MAVRAAAGHTRDETLEAGAVGVESLARVQPGQPPVDLAERTPAQPQAGAHAGLAAGDQVIDPLALAIDLPARIAEPRRQSLEPRALTGDMMLRLALEPAFEDHQLVDEERAFGDRDLAGRGRGGGAHVGDQVRQRHVDLVADGADHRHRAAGDCANHRLFIESRQIFVRPAATPDDEELDPGQPAEPANRLGDLDRGRRALHLARREHDRRGKAALDHPHDVTQCGPGRRGDHPDPARQPGQLALARDVEQALLGEAFLQLLEARRRGARADRFGRVDVELHFSCSGKTLSLPRKTNR